MFDTQMLQAVWDSIPSGIMIWHRIENDLVLDAQNPKAIAITSHIFREGDRLTEVAPRHKEILPDLDTTLIDHYLCCLDPPQTKRREFFYPGDNGRVKGWWRNTCIGLPGDRLLMLFEDISVSKQREVDLEQRAFYDPLSFLLNRISFEEMAKVEDSCLLFIDLDNFRRINEFFGHGQGDKALREIGSRIQNGIRPEDFACRWGGDEYVVLLTGCSASMARAKAVQLLHAIAQPIPLLPNSSTSIGCSIGVAIARPGDSLESLINRADKAMLQIKRDGKNSISLESAAIDMDITLLEQLTDAFDNGQLKVFYQPIYDLTTMSVKGFEALIRWDHPEYGILAPYQQPYKFLALILATGRIEQLTRFVTKQVIEDSKLFPSDFHFSLNVDPSLTFEQMIAIAQQFPRGNFVFEITETERIYRNSIKILPDIRKLVSVALDDFGSEYSTLRLVAEIGFDYIKIDKSLCSKRLLPAIAKLAKALDTEVILEGIEPDQHDLLDLARLVGIQYCQGYMFGKPMPVEEAIYHSRNSILN